jgi:transposase
VAGRIGYALAVAINDPVSDALWEAVQSFLPPEPNRHHGGPPRVSHRAALGGILFILRHGLRWCDLPLELGYGSGVTCWRRLRQWQALGIGVERRFGDTRTGPSEVPARRSTASRPRTAPRGAPMGEGR